MTTRTSLVQHVMIGGTAANKMELGKFITPVVLLCGRFGKQSAKQSSDLQSCTRSRGILSIATSTKCSYLVDMRSSVTNWPSGVV